MSDTPAPPSAAAAIGDLGVWYFTETMAAGAAAEFVSEIESLGYGALWIPETVGRDPMAHIGFLLSQTERITLATGIANIYHRHPGAMAQAQSTLCEQSNNRFLLGLGVSHAPMVEGLRQLDASKPLSTMRTYLEAMAASPYMAPPPPETPTTVLAALGPKMLELSRDATDGAHPYWTTPEHTAQARDILGPDKMLCVEQKLVLTTDPEVARKAGRDALAMYSSLPNYRNNWLRLGFTEADIDTDGGSDKLIDALVGWGDEDALAARIQAHRDAGASHVCIQPLATDGNAGAPDWNLLRALAPNGGAGG